MTDYSRPDRRGFLKHLSLSAGLAAGLGSLPPSVARALDIPARVRTGTLKDVEHIVILTQENRSFDHYFGSLNGVRGFADRFPIPVADNYGRKGKTVWVQPDEKSSDKRPSASKLIVPFHLNTLQNFNTMRVEGTPHSFKDAQAAWDMGRMGNWPEAKHNHSMGYYTRDDLPFQYALAEAFTLCDAYHCAMHAGTNPNRNFIWTGTNDPLGKGHGPVLNNDYDNLKDDPDHHGGYSWTTYPERLQAAGVTWQVYQNMDDNFTDNPLSGFKIFRAADKATSGELVDLARRGVRTRDLTKLREDVLSGQLPQVSWIVATAEGSEHPGPSSPAQGADYTARVLDALTANPEVWSRTVFLINFDENDGFFDHVPPPAVPCRDPQGRSLGLNVHRDEREYHTEGSSDYLNRPYGLGPRVPLYVISPWSRGGFVNSEVFDHTSIIRFIEARFGVDEPNISRWRRAVCGDLTSCFDFSTANDQAFFTHLPDIAPQAARARKLGRFTPPSPDTLSAPVQAQGVRPRRAIKYRFRVDMVTRNWLNGKPTREIAFDKDFGHAGVFQLYNRLNLEASPVRMTIDSGTQTDAWIWSLGEDPMAAFDQWMTGPNGFHRHFMGQGDLPVQVDVYEGPSPALSVNVVINNQGKDDTEITVRDEAYGQVSRSLTIKSGEQKGLVFDLNGSYGWYDLSVRYTSSAGRCVYRYAGHVENGQSSMSDPAMYGPASLDQWMPNGI